MTIKRSFLMMTGGRVSTMDNRDFSPPITSGWMSDNEIEVAIEARTLLSWRHESGWR